MITRPVTNIVQVATAIANGDLTMDIAIRRRDEIGHLAKAFRTMRNTIIAVLKETDRLIQAVQAGQLDTRGNVEAFSGGWRELIVGSIT